MGSLKKIVTSTVSIDLGIFFIKLLCEAGEVKRWRITDPGYLILPNNSEVLEYSEDQKYIFVSADSLIDLIESKKLTFDWTDVEGGATWFEFIDSFWCDISLEESLLELMRSDFLTIYPKQLTQLVEGISHPRGWRKH